MTDWHYVPVKPVTKGRPRLGRKRKAYTPARTLEFEHAVADWWREHADHYGQEFVAVSVEIADRDGFWIKVEPLEANYRPVSITGDLDNYFKAIADGLNTVAWDDDRQIQWIDIRFAADGRIPKKGKK